MAEMYPHARQGDDLCQMIMREAFAANPVVPFAYLGQALAYRNMINTNAAYQAMKQQAGWSNEELFDFAADHMTACEVNADPWGTPTGRLIGNVVGAIAPVFGSFVGGGGGGAASVDDTWWPHPDEPPADDEPWPYTELVIGAGSGVVLGLLAAWAINTAR